MTYLLLSAEMVERIHDRVLNAGELAGRAMDKSLDSVLARVENRVAYGLADDACALAASYAIVIARGHVFNDANKRTAYRAMVVSLSLHGLRLTSPTEAIGPLIVEVAQGRIDEDELATWLRARTQPVE